MQSNASTILDSSNPWHLRWEIGGKNKESCSHQDCNGHSKIISYYTDLPCATAYGTSQKKFYLSREQMGIFPHFLVHCKRKYVMNQFQLNNTDKFILPTVNIVWFKCSFDFFVSKKKMWLQVFTSVFRNQVCCAWFDNRMYCDISIKRLCLNTKL